MDKSILRKFAIESRQELMSKIKNKIQTFYIDEDFSKEQKGELYVLSNEKHSLSLTKEEYQKRELLIKRINELSLEQVIEEAAYTWFNRIIAIRYMEINDMLPLTKTNQSLGIRVLSSKDNTPDPEILKFSNLTNSELDIELKKEKYIELKTDNEKFKYVLLLVCKKLGKVIPQVFDGVTDYIDILIPDNLLNDTGFITKVIKEVPEENYNQVEVIGWLYQYYISEKKDEVFADLKKNIKIAKENIPSATQIFTPNWIVKYMVENTLGRFTSEKFRKTLKYYVENDEEKEEKNITEIKFIDPCCGSGHILVYAFELFYKIYENYGYNKKDIPKMILKNNIYGIDIDDRACQLSTLSVLLKAREYDKSLFENHIELNIVSVQESNKINQNLLFDITDENNKDIVEYVLDSFIDAKEYGSILNIKQMDYNTTIDKIENINNLFSYELKNSVLPLFKQAVILSQKYDVVVTNPPYMGNRGMDAKLTSYVKKHYDNYKTDMFSVFIKKANEFADENGYYAMITQPTFLFLSSFEKIRDEIINNETIVSLLHMGRGIFGVDFGSTSFVIKKGFKKDYLGSYFRLNKRTFQYIEIEDIEKIFLNAKDNMEYTFDFNKYKSDIIVDDEDKDTEDNDDGVLKIKFRTLQSNFNKIPGKPFAYWISESLIKDFEEDTLKEYANVITGMTTGDNNKFLKLWYEINYDDIAFDMKDQKDMDINKKYWYPYSKGGNRRKWFGNYDYIVNWSLSNQFNRSKTTLKDLYFKKALTWPFISSGKFSARVLDTGFLWDVAGSPCFVYDEKNYYYILAFLNTIIADEVLKLINPTINVQAIDLMKLPIIIDKNRLDMIDRIVKENIDISRIEWNSFEISWDFKKHPLIPNFDGVYDIVDGKFENKHCWISGIYDSWEEYINNQFVKLKSNEEQLNSIFLELYKLENEFNSEVSEKDITIRKAERLREVKSLISYAVGCMFGRYSLDEDGLIFAGGKFNINQYKTFRADVDNIIPITDEAYFADDIVGKFKKFIEVVYGTDTLNDNLDFIAETLGKKGTETSEDTIRRYFINDFYSDHIKIYQKKPIYWLFDSGKKNGFKCLIYMHRYNEGLVPKVRLDYLHRIQTTYEKLLSDISYKLTTELSMSDKKEAQKKQAELSGKLQETIEYDEKIAHIANQKINIDLDDGVSINYNKFKDILAKLK